MCPRPAGCRVTVPWDMSAAGPRSGSQGSHDGCWWLADGGGGGGVAGRGGERGEAGGVPGEWGEWLPWLPLQCPETSLHLGITHCMTPV